MKTTTNTTTRRNPNLDRETILEAAPAIMAKAHRITRATIEREPGLDYRATLAAALRELWAEYGLTATEQFQRMTGEQQYDFLIRLTWYEYNHDERISPQTGLPMPGFFEWMRDRRGLDVADVLRGIAHEAYIGLVTALADDDGETALTRYASRAIHRAAARVQRAEHKHANALRIDHSHGADDGPDQHNYKIDLEAGAAAARIDGPETAAILDDIMTRACRDDADRIVLHDTISGYKQRETAALLDIGQRAVAKRLDGIRDRMADALGRDPREKKAPRGKNARTA